MSNLSSKFGALLETYNVRVQTPVPVDEVERQLAQLNANFPDLREFYAFTNGLDKDWFRVFPLEDKSNLKKTWDSLGRANDPAKTRYLREHAELLDSFLVFAEISGGNCALLDRNDKSIWYQDQGLHQTDMSLIDFLQAEFLEVSEIA